MERLLDRQPVKSISLAEAMKSRRVQVRDVRPAHYAALKKLVDFKLIARSKLRFAHEALFGVGAGCFEQLLAGTTCRVTTLERGSTTRCSVASTRSRSSKTTRCSSAFLKKHPHDICLVTDGDADRVGGMDGHGNYAHPPTN